MQPLHLLIIGLLAAAPNVSPSPDVNEGSLPSDSAGRHTNCNSIDTLLQEALEAEAAEDPLRRRVLLEKILELRPDHATAHWHLGSVEFRGDWLSPEDVAERANTDPLLAKYRKVRLQFNDTANEHFNLSRWCRRQGLGSEERAHLLTAVELAPDNARLQRALGRSRFRGRWMSDGEIAQVVERSRQAIDAYFEWRSRLRKLRGRIESRSPQDRAEAQKELAALRDPLAITALEEMISSHSEELGRQAVEVLSQIPHQEATWSLVRHAVWSGWPTVRGAAIDQLRYREAPHYVPALIEYLRPVRPADEVWVRLGDGRPVSVWFWQDFGRNHLFVSDMLAINHFDTFQQVCDERCNGDLHKRVVRELSAAYGLEGMQTVAQIRNAVVNRGVGRAASDSQYRIRNAQAALEQLTGEKPGVDHHAWRKWWSEHNDGFYDPGSYKDSPLTTPFRTNANYNLSSGHCFAASTPVWTRRGPVRIDHVQLADLVLAVNPDTGELAYRPVVGRDVRPKTELRTLQVNGETIESTKSYPVWVSGKGWVKVKDLQAGDPLRGCGEIHTLERLAEGKAALAYNLVVDEFHTYFVGESKVLVHDNTPITDSLLKVPGLRSATPGETETSDQPRQLGEILAPADGR